MDARRSNSRTALAHYAYFLVATPLGWLALWLFCEGLLRVLAAAMDQPFSTLPVVLARAAWRLRPRAGATRRLVLFEHDDGFVIDSARDYDWHALTTVELDGAHYAVERASGYVRTTAPLSPDADHARARRAHGDALSAQRSWS